MKKRVKYLSSNSYETLNQLGDRTQNVWFTFHGIGYLSRYFLSHFKQLPADENYFIAPQAPSKYYLDTKYSKVGASWLTKEDTEAEIENVLAYLDAVWNSENKNADVNLFVLGYSQGVSVAARWVGRRKIRCKKLILYAGGIPAEFEASDFDFLPDDTEVYMIYGNQDPYLSDSRLEKEERRFEELFGAKGRRIVFHGGHELKPDVLLQTIQTET